MVRVMVMVVDRAIVKGKVEDIIRVDIMVRIEVMAVGAVVMR